MEVILLERIEKLGQMGDVVNVKGGYARNYLLPQKKALRATDHNKARFEKERTQLEAVNLERKTEAEGVGRKLDGLHLVLVRQAGDSGQLYGSVSSRDIAEAVTAAGFTVERQQVVLDRPIKAIGLHTLHIALHPEVVVSVTANVARSEEEADIQKRTGVAVISTEEGELPEEVTAEAAPEAEELLEDSAVEALHEREAEEAARDAEQADGEAEGDGSAPDAGDSRE